MVVNIAHRGASAYYTENTISSVKEAIYQKADMIEVDVRFTKDKIPVLFHDPTLHRLAKKNLFVKSLTLKELKQIKLRRNERITTLEQFLDHAKGKIGVVLDVKEDTYEKAIVDLIKARKMESSIIFSSTKVSILKKVRRLDPKLRTAIIFRIPIGVVGLGKSIGAYSLHPHHLGATRLLVSSAHKKGLKVFPYTVNRSKRMKQLLNIGVDGMITNKPVLLRNVIHKFPHNNSL